MSANLKKSLIAVLSVVLALSLTIGLIFVFSTSKPVNVSAADIGKIRYIDVAEDDFLYENVGSDSCKITGLDKTFTDKYIDSSTGKLKDSVDYNGATVKRADGWRLRLVIPAEHDKKPVKFIEEGAFDAYPDIADVVTPNGVYWQVKSYFNIDNTAQFAKADGKTASLTKVNVTEFPSAKLLVIPSPVWYDKDKDGAMDNGEPLYEFSELLSDQSFSDKAYSGNVIESILFTKNVTDVFDAAADESVAIPGNSTGGEIVDDGTHDGKLPTGTQPSVPQDPDSQIAKGYDFSDKIGTYSSNTEIYSDGFVTLTVISSSNPVNIEKSNGLKFKGKGSSTDSALKIDVKGPAKIVIEAVSSNGTAARKLELSGNDSYKEVKDVAGSNSGHTICEFDVQAGTYFAYSTSGGINICKITITENSTSSISAPFAAISNPALKESDYGDLLNHGAIRKMANVESIYFATGRTKVLTLQEMTFEDYTNLKLINLSHGVFLSGGARVFQGALKLERVLINEESNANVPEFYVLGDGGALYTDNYSYSYYDREGFKDYLLWFGANRNYQPDALTVGSAPASATTAFTPANAPQPNAKTIAGDEILPIAAGDIYYAKGSSGNYDSGIGVPDGSIVIDVGGKSGDKTERPGKNFEKGESGNYKDGANFSTYYITGNFSGTTDIGYDNIKFNVSGSSSLSYNNGGDNYYYEYDGVKYWAYLILPKPADTVTYLDLDFTASENDYSITVYAITNDGSKTNGNLELSDSEHKQLAKAVGLPHRGSTLSSNDTVLLKYDGIKKGNKYSLASILDDKNSNNVGIVSIVLTPIPKEVVSTDPALNFKLAEGEDNTFYASSPDRDKAFSIEGLNLPEDVTFDESKVDYTFDPEENLVPDTSYPLFEVDKSNKTIKLNNELTTEKFDKLNLANDKVTITATYSEGLTKPITATLTFTLKKYPDTKKLTINYGGKPLEGDKVTAQLGEGALTFEFTYELDPEYAEPVSISAHSENLTDANIVLDSGSKTITVKNINVAGTYDFTVASGTTSRKITIEVTGPQLNIDKVEVDQSKITFAGSGSSTTVNVTVTYSGEKQPDLSKLLDFYTSSAGKVTVTIKSPTQVSGTKTVKYAVEIKSLTDTPVRITFWAQGDDGVVKSASTEVWYSLSWLPDTEGMPAPKTESKVRYQRLIVRPAMYNGEASYSNPDEFTFSYAATTEIGKNAFQGTQLTVIEIPDRISTIDDYAFMMSKTLQTVYMPTAATLGTAIFGQESDADGTNIYTAGKKNFVIVAPSRQAYLNYLNPKETPNFDDDNDDGTGTDNTGYVYSRYLGYEVEVTYKDGDNIVGSETKLFGKFYYGTTRDAINTATDANIFANNSSFVKAADTTQWVAEAYDNNVAIEWGHRSKEDKNNEDKWVQVNNIPSSDWYVTAGGWYWYDSANSQPLDGAPKTIADNSAWYYGQTEISSAEVYSKLLSGQEITGVTYEAGNVLPYSVVLTKAQTDKQQAIADVTVPGFQDIGTPVIGGAYPTITVDFDFTGYRAERFLSNFNINRMEVEYTKFLPYGAEGDVLTDGQTPTTGPNGGLYDPTTAKTRAADGIPYDAGTYLVTVSMNAASKDSAYDYQWAGTYNGARLTSSQKKNTESYQYILVIKPREISVPAEKNVKFVEGNEDDVVIFENNAYYSVEKYLYYDTDEFIDDSTKLSANGYPAKSGTYQAKLHLRDPKYDGKAEKTPNLIWVNGETVKDNPDEADVLLIIDENPTITPPQLIAFNGGKTTEYNTKLTYEYTGMPVLEELFGESFQDLAMQCEIEKGTETLSEVKDVGTYTITVTPKDGFKWREGSTYKGEDITDDAQPLEYTVEVTPILVDVPADQLINTTEEAGPYAFILDTTAKYTVTEYKKVEGGEEVGDSLPSVTAEGEYNVYLTLNDTVNYAWAQQDDNHDGTIHVTLTVVASLQFDKPEFNEDLGGVIDGDQLTITYSEDFTPTWTNLFKGFISTYMVGKINTYSAGAANAGIPSEIKNAGTYTLKITLKDGTFTGGDESANYTVVINKAPIGEPENLDQSSELKNGTRAYALANNLYTVVSYEMAGWSGKVPDKPGVYTVTLAPVNGNYTWSNHTSTQTNNTITATLTIGITLVDLPTFRTLDSMVQDGTSLVTTSKDLKIAQIFDLTDILAFNGLNTENPITLQYGKAGESLQALELGSSTKIPAGTYVFEFTIPAEAGARWNNPEKYDAVTATVATFNVILGGTPVTAPTAKSNLTYSGSAFGYADVLDGFDEAKFEVEISAFNGSGTASEIKNAGTYTLKITPKAGYVWDTSVSAEPDGSVTVEVTVDKAKVTLSHSGDYTFRTDYTGEETNYTHEITSGTEGFSIDALAASEHLQVKISLVTNGFAAGTYTGANLTVTLTLEASDEMYSGNLANFEAVVETSVTFTIEVVKQQVTAIAWKYDSVTPITNDNKTREYDAAEHTVTATATVQKVGGTESVELKVNLAATKGALTEGKIRNVGQYTATVQDGIYAFAADVQKNISLEVTPFLIELEGHDLSAVETGDALFGASPVYQSGEITANCGSEEVKYSYKLDASKVATADQKTTINGTQYVNVGEYKFDKDNIEFTIVPGQVGIDAKNYDFKLSVGGKDDYVVQIMPLALSYTYKESAVYKGYRHGADGNFTVADLGLVMSMATAQPNAENKDVAQDVKDNLSNIFTLSFSGTVVRNVNEYTATLTLNDSANYTLTQRNSLAFEVTALQVLTELSENTTKQFANKDYKPELYVRIFIYDTTKDGNKGDEITEYFYEAGSLSSGNPQAVKVDKDGVFGVTGGNSAVTLEFYTNADRTESAEEVKNVGTYYGKAVAAESLNGNFVNMSTPADNARNITITALVIDLEDIDINALAATVEGLEKFLVYSATAKTIVISDSVGFTTGPAAGKENSEFHIALSDLTGYTDIANAVKAAGTDITITITAGNPAVVGEDYSITLDSSTVKFGDTENVTVGNSATATLEVTPFEAEVTWTNVHGNMVGNTLTVEYDGGDHYNDIGFSITNAAGGQVSKATTGSVLAFEEEISLTRSGVKHVINVLKNADTYTVTVKLAGDRANNYTLTNDTLTVTINPYVIKDSDITRLLTWYSSSGSPLQSGTHNVETLSGDITADNSFVKFREGVSSEITLNDSYIPKYPASSGMDMFTLSYSGNTGTAKGKYDATATLTPTVSKVNLTSGGSLEFTNFKWDDTSSTQYGASRASGGYGETYEVTGGNLVITKTWYIVELSNGLATDPVIEDWTFGAFDQTITAPVADKTQNAAAQLLLSFGRIPDGEAVDGDTSKIPDKWITDFELDRNFTGTRTEPTDVKDEEAEIKSFLDKWINAATPAGRYALITVVPEVKGGSGEALYPEFTEVFTFEVKAAKLTADKAIGDMSAEYNQKAHYPAAGDLPTVNAVTVVRMGTGWAESSLTRPASPTNTVDLNALYGTEATLLYSIDGENYYEADDLSLKMPTTTNIQPSGGTFVNEPYTIYYKYSLINHEEYLTVGGVTQNHDNSCYKLTIKAVHLDITADTSDGVTVGSDGLISWAYGGAETLTLSVTGVVDGDTVIIGCRFVPADSSFAEGSTDDTTVYTVQVTAGGKISIDLAALNLDAENYVLRLFMGNYGEADSDDDNENYTVNDKAGASGEDNGTGILKLHVTVDPKQIKNSSDMSLPGDQQTTYNAQAKNYALRSGFDLFKVQGYEEAIRINAGDYKVYIAFNTENYVFAEGGDLTLENVDGTMCLVVTLTIRPVGLTVEVGDVSATYGTQGAKDGVSVTFKSGGGSFAELHNVTYSITYADLNGAPVNLADGLNAGVYAVTVRLTDDSATNMFVSNVSGGDFALSAGDNHSVTGSFTIGKATISITSKPVSAGHIHIYNGTDYGAKVFGDHYIIGSTLPADAYKISFKNSEDVAVDELINAGSYKIYFSLVGDYDNNYKVSYNGTEIPAGEVELDDNFTIGKATISARLQNSLTYNGEERSAEEFGYVLTNSRDGGVLPAAANVKLSCAEIIKDAKSYTVTITLDAVAFANFQFPGGRDFVSIANARVEKADLTVRANDQRAVYNGKPYTVSYTTSAAVGGADVTITYNGSPEAPVNAGTYTVVITVNESENYTSATATVTLVIERAEFAFAFNGSRTFGFRDADMFAQLKSRVTPIGATVPAQSQLRFTLTLGGKAVTEFKAVGNYTLTVGLSDEASQNFEVIGLNKFTGIVIMGERIVSVEWEEVTYTYDGSVKAMPAAYGVTDLGNRVPLNVSIAADRSSYNQFKNVGAYTFTASVPNNLFSYGNGLERTKTYSILPASAHLSGSAFTFAYDGKEHTLPGFDVEWENGTLEEGLYFVTSATHKDIGVYTYTVTLPANGNFVFEGGGYTATVTLEITKSSTEVKAEGRTTTFNGQQQGIAAPEVTDFADEVIITYNGSSVEPINAGEYTVVVTIPETSNYTGATKTVTLVIEKKSVSVVWGGSSFTESGNGQTPYGGLSEELTEGYAEVRYTQNGISLMGEPSAEGEYTVTVKLVSAPNFELYGETEKSFTIAKGQSSQPTPPDGEQGGQNTVTPPADEEEEEPVWLISLMCALTAVCIIAAIPCTATYVKRIKRK